MTAEQIENCTALADHLEQNVTDEDYNHMSWDPSDGAVCALGHAALAGIGGMTIIEGCPTHPDYYDQERSFSRVEESAAHIFGSDSMEHIFQCENHFNRDQAIVALRAQAQRNG